MPSHHGGGKKPACHDCREDGGGQPSENWGAFANEDCGVSFGREQRWQGATDGKGRPVEQVVRLGGLVLGVGGHVQGLVLSAGGCVQGLVMGPELSGVRELPHVRLVNVDWSPIAHVANRPARSANCADPDVAELDVSIRAALAHLLWAALSRLARASLGSQVGALLGVGAVEPVHVRPRGVVPDAHDENHAAVQGITSSFQAAPVLEVRGVSKCSLLLLAEVVGHGGRRLVDQTGGRHLDRLAILLVRTSDLDKVAFVGPVAGQELRSDRHGFGGVDLKARTGPEESFVPEPPVVPVAAVPVALPLRARRIPVLSGSALQARALYGTRVRASVHRERG
mmetsp:Transcript_90971/g.254106  ORF Transcript_90971/g.254106 Transcript_90971/m.254106 type:complete len:339 (+) Transcript_90971:199-1215(+)